MAIAPTNIAGIVKARDQLSPPPANVSTPLHPCLTIFGQLSRLHVRLSSHCSLVSRQAGAHLGTRHSSSAITP